MLPGDAVIAAAITNDGAVALLHLALDEGFTQIDQVTVARTDRAVRRVHRRPYFFAPGFAVVVAEHDPGAGMGRYFFVGQALQRRAPAFPLLHAHHILKSGSRLRVLDLLTHIDRGPTDEDGAAAKVDHTGIAVVQRRAVNGTAL